MRSDRSALARLAAVRAVHLESSCGVRLDFRLARPWRDVVRIDDYADLGPERTTEAVLGLGKVLRVLRAARIAAPREPAGLMGCADEAADRLARAVGVELRLVLRPRSAVRFTAWTETGREVVDDVLEVREDGDAFWVLRRDGFVPVRIERDAVVRRRTDAEHWFEVLSIERA